MVEQGRPGGTYGSSQMPEGGGLAAGAIIATALAAGVVAYFVKRSREEREAAMPVGRVAQFARTFADSDSAEMGRDFFVEKILPEFKPALLAILSELEDVVDQMFRRVEKGVKKL